MGWCAFTTFIVREMKYMFAERYYSMFVFRDRRGDLISCPYLVHLHVPWPILSHK